MCTIWIFRQQSWVEELASDASLKAPLRTACCGGCDGLCPTHCPLIYHFLNYLSTSMCLIHLKGYNKNSPMASKTFTYLTYLKALWITLNKHAGKWAWKSQMLIYSSYSCCDILWWNNAVFNVPPYSELIHNHRQPRSALVVIHRAGWIWSPVVSAAFLSKLLCFPYCFCLNTHTYFEMDFTANSDNCYYL